MRVTILYFFLLVLLQESLHAQINASNQTVFVAGNWSNYDHQLYEIAIERYSIHKGDTTSHLNLKYEAMLTVKDSTSNNYVLEWRYKNLKSKNKRDRINKRLHDLGKNVPLLLKTDDTGQLLDLVNWEQVKVNMEKEIDVAKKEYAKYPNAQMTFEQKRKSYQTKAEIEANGMADVQQLLFFHGIQYQKDIETSFNDSRHIVLRNHNGSNGALLLRNINESEDVVLLQYEYCKTTLPPSEMVSMPLSRGAQIDLLDENFPLAHSDHKITSTVQASTGWLLESTEESRITCQNTTTIERRTIKNKQYFEPRFNAAIR